MAKKIRFSLEMEHGVEVRTLEELRNNIVLFIKWQVGYMA